MSNAKRSLQEVAEILRGLDASLQIQYGSGGFCVILHDGREKADACSFSWDAEEAFEKAFTKLQETRLRSWEDRIEKTNPGVRSETKKILR